MTAQTGSAGTAAPCEQTAWSARHLSGWSAPSHKPEYTQYMLSGTSKPEHCIVQHHQYSQEVTHHRKYALSIHYVDQITAGICGLHVLLGQ